MGRVDEALRRARGEEPPPAMPAEALASEPFPDEAADAPVRLNGAAAPPVEKAPSVAESTALFKQIGTTLAGKVVVDRSIEPASREQYRRLAATLLSAQATAGIKVVMVTSAAAGEGKTLTASNLALTFSESYLRRVLLVDGDLRCPSLQHVFNFAAAVGLSEALTSAEDQRLTLHQASRHLTIVPAGAPSADPMAGLSSERMRRIIDEARDAFDWIIIDTPPVGLLSDASLLSAMVDGVVLVVKAGATHFDRVQRAVDAVGRERVLGVVLNRVSADQSPAYDAYHRYYAGPGSSL